MVVFNAEKSFLEWILGSLLFRLGLVWTFFNIKDNWEVYRTYPSVVTQVGLKTVYLNGVHPAKISLKVPSIYFLFFESMIQGSN